jgi:hypothetical protein
MMPNNFKYTCWVTLLIKKDGIKGFVRIIVLWIWKDEKNVLMPLINDIIS